MTGAVGSRNASGLNQEVISCATARTAYTLSPSIRESFFRQASAAFDGENRNSFPNAQARFKPALRRPSRRRRRGGRGQERKDPRRRGGPRTRAEGRGSARTAPPPSRSGRA